MNVIICGDRNWSNVQLIEEIVKLLDSNVTVIHGAASGADSLAGIAATKRNLNVVACPANWEKYGKAAGPIRNKYMYDTYKPIVVLAFHNDITASKGTKHMCDYAKQNNTEVIVITETYTREY